MFISMLGQTVQVKKKSTEHCRFLSRTVCLFFSLIFKAGEREISSIYCIILQIPTRSRLGLAKTRNQQLSLDFFRERDPTSKAFTCCLLGCLQSLIKRVDMRLLPLKQGCK